MWRKAVKGLSNKLDELPSGPTYATPEGNPPEFLGRKQEFKPGEIHNRVAAWRRLDPQIDREVQDWIENGFEVPVHEEATGLRLRNGKVARENPEDFQRLLFKRLVNESWEVADAEGIINIIPGNMAPKPSASDLPWRFIINGMPVNEFYKTWKIKYESLKTVPLAVSPGCYMVTIDLESGYDAVKLTERSRGLFGISIRFSPARWMELLGLGLAQAGQAQKTYADGSVMVYLRPRTLPQGWTNSCAVFTKLTRQLCRVWRKRGYRLVHLLDDFLFCADSYEEAVEIRDRVLADCEALGLYISWKKAVLTPSRRVKFIGFVIDSETMRFHVPGEKVEDVEKLIADLTQEPAAATFRQLARVAGKIVAMGTAISAWRLFTRETYRCICPEDDWDESAPVTAAMVQELLSFVEWVRVFNARGAPIRRPAKQTGIRLMMDASVDGLGVRLDGYGDLVWQHPTWAMAGAWTGPPREVQAHRELAALEEVLQRALQEQRTGEHKWGLCKRLSGRRLLLWSDSVATVAYVKKGAGDSDEMSAIMKRVFVMCLELECSVWAEHVAGATLVAAGVDALSRATEFALSKAVFHGLQQDPEFGCRGGFSGFTVDACASVKTRKLRRYFSRGGVGVHSEGDVRTAPLSQAEHYFVCPPIGLIETVLQRVEEAEICATVVVPNWVEKAWHVRLRGQAVATRKLPWDGYRATWVDVSEGKPKPHELAQKWEFVVFAVDGRPQHQHNKKGVAAIPRWKDDRPRMAARSRLQFGGTRGFWGHQPRRAQQRPVQVFRVLSMCGGMGSTGWALKQVRELFKLQMQIKVVEVEFDAVARALAERLSGDVSEQVQPHDLWDWVSDTAQGKAWVKALGPVDLVVCGFSCRDMSVAHRRGKGLQGDNSNVYFAAVQVLRWVLEFNAGVDFVFECTVFRNKHPRDWDFVGHDLGAWPVVLDAGVVSPVWRKRAFWASFTMLPMQAQGVPVRVVLEEGRRPARRWQEKLPTIMASGPTSWNQKDCVETWVKGRWQRGSLRVSEVAAAMGFGVGCTAGATMEGHLLTDRQRWHGLGNAIHASVLCHVMVSVLVSRGLVTAEEASSHRQSWTRHWGVQHQDYAGEHSFDGDGPQATTMEVACARLEAITAASRAGAVGRAKGRSKTARRAKVAAVKAYMEHAQQHGVPTDAAPTWASIQQCRDTKGVPRMHGLGRDIGAPRPQRPAGENYWGFVDGMMADLMVLSRAESTWQQYSAWYGVFEEWAGIMGVCHRTAELWQLRAVLGRALTIMWHGGGYAASTLELFATAVAATIDDEGRGRIKDDSTIKRLLEGINRNLGNAVNKKLAIEGRHIRAVIMMGNPERDGRAWTGDHYCIQWFQLTAAMSLGWAGYLRCQDICNLQLCDCTWEDECVSLLIRRAKADQRGVTTVTCVGSLVSGEGGVHDGDISLLSFFIGYVEAVHGDRHRQRKGCTRDVGGKRAYDCPVCPYLFPAISIRGVEPRRQLGDRMLRLRMKAACVRLETAGILAEGATKNFSVISLRRGGNSVAAARGVRDRVRTNHGRWGLAGAVKRGQTSEGEYNSVLSRDDGAVLKALHADLNEVSRGKKRAKK